MVCALSFAMPLMQVLLCFSLRDASHIPMQHGRDMFELVIFPGQETARHKLRQKGGRQINKRHMVFVEKKRQR